MNVSADEKGRSFANGTYSLRARSALLPLFGSLSGMLVLWFATRVMTFIGALERSEDKALVYNTMQRRWEYWQSWLLMLSNIIVLVLIAVAVAYGLWTFATVTKVWRTSIVIDNQNNTQFGNRVVKTLIGFWMFSLVMCALLFLLWFGALGGVMP